MILRLPQRTYKISLEHLVAPESKEMLKKKKNSDTSEGHRSQLKELPTTKAGTL